MHLRLQLCLPLIVLTIVDLCLSVPSFVNTNSRNDRSSLDVSSIASNKFHKLNSNRQSNVIDTSDDDIRHTFNGDKHESKTIRRNNADAAESSMSFDEDDYGDDDDEYNDDSVSDRRPLNFLITNFLSDGEIERRIHFDGITAKETLVVNSG